MKGDLKHDILARYFAGELSEDQKLEVRAWLEDAGENQKEFDSLQELMTKSSQLNGLFDAQEGWADMKQRIEAESRSGFFTIGKIAASVAFVIVAVLAYFWLNLDNSQSSYIVAESTVLEQQLADGTLITLNTGTELEISSDFGEKTRTVSLSGEAYFDVARDESKVFRVIAANTEISVLGTEFNVSVTDSSTIVNVFEGRVRVQSGDEIVILNVDDKIEVHENGTISKKITADLNDIFWKTGDLEFNSIPLEAALRTIGSKFGQVIYLDVTNSENCLLTTSFEDASLEDVLEIIALTYNLEIKEAQQVIRLTGPGCD